MKEKWQTQLQHTKRLVVKVGTSTIAQPSGELNIERVKSLVEELVESAREREVLLVTSGAIGIGATRLGLFAKPKTIPAKQAAAAVGQGLLMQIYEKFFSEYGKVVAQVLLTRADLGDRHRYLNARNALNTLFSYDVIPIVNENDTVAVDEIKIGDNDTLAANITALIDADLLVILSDVDGLYTADPRADAGAQKIALVREITPQLERLAGSAGSAFGTGGMQTKLSAAQIATKGGASMAIVDGAKSGNLVKLLSGQCSGTLFLPQAPLAGRKMWLAFNPPLCGKITVDEGAKEALLNYGKSLLPSGIVSCEDDFFPGDLVAICGPDGREFARGLVNYEAAELNQIKGLKTNQIEAVLGHRGYLEAIHRDNLVLL